MNSNSVIMYLAWRVIWNEYKALWAYDPNWNVTPLGPLRPQVTATQSNKRTGKLYMDDKGLIEMLICCLLILLFYFCRPVRNVKTNRTNMEPT